MTTTIQEGLDQLFELVVPLSLEFNKKTYEQIFMSKYEEFHALFDEMQAYCADTEDLDAAVEELSEVIPAKMHAMLDTQNSKRKKENLLMKYNLGMVTFIIPMLLYGREKNLEKIADRIIMRWNDNGVAMDIGKSTYEEIAGGFKTHLCYITTAVCENLGKEDDCYELNLLRTYRDDYLAQQADGRAVIEEYYDIAPTIVKRIGRMEDSKEIYRGIWEEYLSPCVKLIEAGKEEECGEKYTEMVHSLEEKYIYS